MYQRPQATKRREDGIALLVTVVLLLLLSAVGVTALQRAQDETVGGDRLADPDLYGVAGAQRLERNLTHAF